MRRMAREQRASDPDALEQLLNEEGMEATRNFLREARAFDSSISDKDLFQALRNVWVIHSVQLLLGAPIALSPAVFGYSMLYPWTDNRLDDPRLGRAAKAAFGEWLTLRLAGEHAPPLDPHGEQVSALIGRIEQHFSRPEFPQVYLSLQAIHSGQMRSLNQQTGGGELDEASLLQISIAKGGASVLADAYLVRGWLSEDEAQFMFAYGVVLQFMDDLQDLHDDLANVHTTLFTRQARSGLYNLTRQLWAFTQRVLGDYAAGVAGHPATCSTPIFSLIEDNLRMLLLQSVARYQEFYTPAFVSALEDCSPVRFSYLARQEKSLSARYSKLLAAIRRNRKLDSVFEMLD
jgi:hypothetical protein